MNSSKKISLIACIISSVVSIAAFVGIGIYAFSSPTSLEKNQIQFKADFNNTENIYMTINSTYIQYDLVHENQNKTGYLLTRFFSSPIPTFAQTFLDSSYVKKTKWDIFNIDNNNDPEENEFKIIYNSKNLPIFISLYSQNIEISYDRDNVTPLTYNKKYLISDFVFSSENKNSEASLEPETVNIFSLLNNIKNPNSTEISEDDNFISNLLPPSDVSPRCLIDLTYKAMASGQNLVATDYCNGYFVVGLPGTNFKNAGDIYANVKGALVDNYKTGFDRLKNFDKTKIYDICAGYSLGGAIAKYMSKFKYCKNIVTFGAPLTRDYNKNIPIIEYINVQDDDSEEGCCEFNWNMECKTRGKLLTDPVTTILYGYHYNKKYIGKYQNENCIGKFAYTVWKTGFTLHETYYNNLL